MERMDIKRQSPAQLWHHRSPKSTAMYKFLQQVKATYNLNLDDYQGLHRWSIENIPEFWEEIWRFCKIKASKQFDQVRVPLYTSWRCIPVNSVISPSYVIQYTNINHLLLMFNLIAN